MHTTRHASHAVHRRFPTMQLVGVIAVLLALTGAVLVLTGQMRIAVIMSGSMNPVWSTGALVLLWRTAGSSLHTGELVGFTPPAPFPHELIVHRIVMIEQHSLVVTKGDANASSDPWTLSAHGHFFSVVGHWNYLGTILHDVTQPAGWISLGLLVGGSLLRLPPLHRRRSLNNKKQNLRLRNLD